MAIPVYVQSVVTYPGRTAWDTTGATNYAVGDRVYYDDGTLEKVYVCIVGNTSTTTPDNDSTNWILAGSKEYPFLSGSNGGLWSTGYSNTELCLRYDGGFNTQWDPARTLSISDGSTRAHIILMDGVFELNENTNYSNTDFYAENFQKAFLVQRYYDHASTTNTENCPTFNNLKLGLLNQQASFEAPLVLNNCLVTTKTPLGNKIKTMHRFQYQDFIKATDCLFDFSLCDNNLFIAGESSGPSVLHGPTSFKNCTIIFNKGESQYGGLMYAGHASANTIIDNCIFYFLGQVEQSQPKVVSHSNMTVTNTCVFAESFSDQPFIAGISTVDDSNHLNVNPLFADAPGGDYRLKPSSPLIGGGFQAQNALAEKHPNGVWVDHNHTPTQSAHSYTLDSGDGSSYTVSGDATGSDPTLNVSTRDTLTFTNNTGGHPLAIYNSQGHAVASESGGTTTFTPLYPDTYYYQCTTTGHESMRGDIVVTNGTLGSYENPFVSYHDAIDSGYFDSKLTLLFKEGDHLMTWYAGTNAFNSAGVSSTFPDGLYFIGENHKARLTTGDNFNTYGAFYVTNFTGSDQSKTPLFLEDICIHINNTTSYINRGVFCGTFWKSFRAKSLLLTCDLNSIINSNPLDYFSDSAVNGYSFKLSGCEFNVPLSDNNGPGGSFLAGDTKVIYEVESCTFAKLTGYSYLSNFPTPSPIMVGAQFATGSTIKNCIFYTNTGGDFGSYNPISGVFSSCVIHSTTNSFVKLPPDMSLNSDADPLFISTVAGSEDLRLRPSSLLVGGLKSEDSSVYYLQPGNTYNGDGSQKDASAMTADGDPGPFNSFTNVRAANIPFNSKVIIINGTYSWPSELSPPYASIGSGGPSTGYEGYNYIAEYPQSVIFDANGDDKFIVCNPKVNNSHADLDTTFNGIVFKDSWTNFYNNMTRAAINTWTDIQGQGSLTFDRCSFENWQILSTNASFIGHQMYGEKGIDITFTGCSMSFAFDGGGGLFGNYSYGGNDYEGVHTYKNNTIVIKGAGSSFVGGRNATTGYAPPTHIFSSADNTQKIFEGNILFIENNSSKTGTFTGTHNTASKFPQLKNNLFYDVNFGASESVVASNNLFDIDPLFVDVPSNNLSLRPQSPIIGQG